MKSKIDFNFKGKVYMPNIINSGPSKNKISIDESKFKNEPLPRPVVNEVKKEERQIQNMYSVSFRNREEGKSSI